MREYPYYGRCNHEGRDYTVLFTSKNTGTIVKIRKMNVGHYVLGFNNNGWAEDMFGIDLEYSHKPNNDVIEFNELLINLLSKLNIL